MAIVVGKKSLTCPRCGVEATVQTWSCTCQTVPKATHKEGIGREPHADFNKHAKDCGAKGRPERH